MKVMPLEAYVKEKGQAVVAEQLGVHQTAISKAVLSGRNVTVTQLPNGIVQAEEKRPFPSKKH